MPVRLGIALASLLVALTTTMSAGVLDYASSPNATLAEEARLRGVRFERAISAMRRVLQAWLTHADQRTLLLPDRVPGPGSGLPPGDNSRVYTPHNSGADLYPYLILTSELTDPDLYRGRMLEKGRVRAMLPEVARYFRPD